jgi:hypothetical protein
MAITINGTTGIAGVDGSAGTPAVQGTDTNTGIFFPAADTIAFGEGGAEVMRLDSSANLQFNSGYGSVATAYGCRAWVNFNGTGTPAIRASGNVSSITDDGTGQYRVNFTNAMPDVNYSLTMSVQEDSGGGARFCNGRGTWTSSSAYIEARSSSATFIDPQFFWVAVFR